MPKQIGRRILAAIVLVGTLGIAGCAADEVNHSIPDTPEATANNIAVFNETSQYAEDMEKYQEMDISTFEEMPRDERLLYSRYLIESTTESGNYNKIYGVGGACEAFGVEYTTPARDNNGQEIVNSFIYSYQTAYLQFVEGETKPYDAMDGQKILSAMYYNVGEGVITQSYLDVKNKSLSLKAPVAVSEKFTATNTGELMSGKDTSGETLEYKDVTFYTDSAKTIYARYVYHEFTSYDGERESIWLLDVMSDSTEELQKESIIR